MKKYARYVYLYFETFTNDFSYLNLTIKNNYSEYIHRNE